MRQAPFLFVLLISSALAGCGGGSSSPSSPSQTTNAVTTVGGSASLGWIFTADAGQRSFGGGPLPIVIGSQTILYLAQSPLSRPGYAATSTDGLNFTELSSVLNSSSIRSIVVLPDGRYRQYWLNTSDVMSRISTNGTIWTDETGVRYTVPHAANQVAGGVPKIVPAPGGGYRMYYVQACTCETGIQSAFSSDGMSFTEEPGLRIGSPGPTGDLWGDPAVVNTGSGWLMIVTLLDRNSQFSSLWLASSNDGLTWTLDNKGLVTDPVGSPADAAFVQQTVGGGWRIYYAVFPGTGAANPPSTPAGVATPIFIKSGVFHR